MDPLERLLEGSGLCGIFRTIGCIGDSLCSGEMESLKNGIKGYHDYYEYSWGQYMARFCGSTAYNFSRGGLTAREFLECLHQDRFNILDAARRCQAYIVALGVNDISAMLRGETVMGGPEDIHPDCPEKNAATFAGDMGRILSLIRQAEPKARIFLVTMPVVPDRDPARVEPEERHAELMRAMAEMFPFTRVLDLRRYGAAHDAAFKRLYYLGDHLNAAGYLYTARQFMTYIDFLIRQEPELYTQTAFIGRGDDLHNEGALW